MPNQLAIIGAPDLYAQAARKFLQLLPASCIAAEQMFLDSIKRSLSPPPAAATLPSSGALELTRSTSPPRLTASPLRSTSGHQLERPSPVRPSPSPAPATPKFPLTNLSVLPQPLTPPTTTTPGAGTNPFDDPLPTHTPVSRSRSGSDASSSSLISMSSLPSTSTSAPPQAHPQAVTGPANGTEATRARSSSHANPQNASSSSSSGAAGFWFEHTSPAMAYMNSLGVARERVRECTNRCKCWSSVYDRCKASKETLLLQQQQQQQQQQKRVGKSLEMEDVVAIKISVSGEERHLSGGGVASQDGEEYDVETTSGSFRSRSTTLAASASRLSRNSDLRNHDSLHSRRARLAAGAAGRDDEEGAETRMVAGARSATAKHAQNGNGKLDLPPSRGLRRSGTISGGSRPTTGRGSPRQSPRLERRVLTSGSQSSKFEDKVGLFLKVVMDKLMEMLQHPPTVNVLLTRLVSRLAHYPQPLLRSLLLNHQLVLKPGVPNLLTVSASTHAHMPYGYNLQDT